MTDASDTKKTPFGRAKKDKGTASAAPKPAESAQHPGKVPEPPRRSRGARSQFVIFCNFVMTIVVLVAVAGVAAVYFGGMQFERAGPLDESTTFLVRKGAGITEIANELERSGIIYDARVFRAATLTTMRNDTLKAGEYEIKAGASMHDVMDLLRSGKSILYALTLPEGLTVEEIFERVASDDVLTGDMPESMPPEGSLLPETYKFTRGASRQEIIAKMEAAEDKVLDQVWSHRDSDIPIDNKQDLVTLASIVEKETGKPDERPRVAAVFMNRLEKGMRLQSDPTIIYGLFGGAGKPSDRPLYKSDLEKKTPYNTYLIDGLPPTPIANPGRAALEAVANPSKTGDLYFVADGTGGHVFASTLKEHNANVRRWREIQAARSKKTDEAEAEN